MPTTNIEIEIYVEPHTHRVDLEVDGPGGPRVVYYAALCDQATVELERVLGILGFAPDWSAAKALPVGNGKLWIAPIVPASATATVPVDLDLDLRDVARGLCGNPPIPADADRIAARLAGSKG